MIQTLQNMQGYTIKLYAECTFNWSKMNWMKLKKICAGNAFQSECPVTYFCYCYELD